MKKLEDEVIEDMKIWLIQNTKCRETENIQIDIIEKCMKDQKLKVDVS